MNYDPTLVKVRAVAITRFKKKRRANGGYRHASHDACEALEEAAKAFEFEHFGVEGWCDDLGASGISYLNTGDTYTQTVYAITSANSATFKIGDQEQMQAEEL